MVRKTVRGCSFTHFSINDYMWHVIPEKLEIHMSPYPAYVCLVSSLTLLASAPQAENQPNEYSSDNGYQRICKD